MGAQHQIVFTSLDRKVHDRNRGHSRGPFEPLIAAIQGHEKAKLGT